MEGKPSDRDRLEAEVDQSHLTVTGAHEGRASRVSIIPGVSPDDAIIVVTEAFGPQGHSLVGVSDVTFSGFPAVTVGVRAGDREGQVHLSPIHGDKRKRGFTDIEAGTKVELFCPTCKEPLPKVSDVEDGSGASYYAIYLTKKLDKGSMVMISDVWDHFHSRIVDDNDVLSYWASVHDPG
jgi:hypothetical protein